MAAASSGSRAMIRSAVSTSIGRVLAVCTQSRLLLVADQPVEDRERHHRQQKAAHGAEHEAERTVERADLAVEDRVGEAHGEQRHDDQRGEEHDGRRHRLQHHRLVDIGRKIRQHIGVEIIGRRRRRGPGADRQHLAGEAAHHRQQRGNEDDAEHAEIEIRRHQSASFGRAKRRDASRRGGL